MRPMLTYKGLNEALDGYEKWVTENIDDAIAERKKALALEGKLSPCGKGCTRCCELMVTVRPADALRIARRLRREGLDSPQTRAELQDYIDFAMDIGRAHKEDNTAAMEILAKRHPCSFIKDGACSVYEDRPVVCRLFNTLGTVEACLDEKEKEKQLRMVTNDLKGKAADVGLKFAKMAWAPDLGLLQEMVLWGLEELEHLEKKP